MKAVILAAGIASRLRPLTNNTPKCLLKVGDKSILQRTMDNLITNGIEEYIFVTGYLENQIKSFLSETYPGLNIAYITNEKYESTNNIYSLWLTKDFIRNQNMLLLDSDIVFDSRIIKLLCDSGYDNCLAVKTGLELSEEEIKVTVNEDNSIIDISKIVDPQTAIGESIGIEKFSASFVNTLFDELDQMISKENLVDIFYEAAFERVIKNGQKVYSVPVGELKCLEIDFSEDFKKANQEVVDMF